MKKMLLLLMAASAFGVSAQLLAHQPVKYAETTPVYVDGLVDAPAAYDEMVSPASKVQRRAANVEPLASYKRPAGVFYGAHTTTEGQSSYSTFYTPAFLGFPYLVNTFVNNSVNLEGATSQWTYQKYSREDKARHWYDFVGQDLALYYSMEVDSIPHLVVTNEVGSSEFFFQGGKTNSAKTAVDTWYYSNYLAEVDYQTAYTNTADRTLWVTSKYFAANTNRDASKLAGSYYMSGAVPVDEGDEERSGRWLGRNASGVDGLGVAFEKPEHPYVLRKVGVRYQGLTTSMEENVEFAVEVYRIDNPVAFEDSVTLSPVLEEKIAEGYLVMTPEEIGNARNGLMQFELKSIDEDGIEIDLTPEIDFPILITFTGYNVPAVGKEFTLLRSSDTFDEGYGDLAYMGRRQDDGTIQYICAHNFFASSPVYGFSILAEVEHPFLTAYYTIEDGEYNFPVEGGPFNKQYTETFSVDCLSLYSYKSVDEMDYALADGSEIPAWLHLEVADELADGEFANEVTVNAVADALPEGVAYREAIVRFHIPGAYYDYKFTQGEKSDEPEPGVRGDVNGDGSVGIDDVNMAINMMLGTLDQTAAADLNGDGTIGIDDVNSIINIMLGK